jgi:DNA polymerase IV (DinB-like DNA polymerase)
MDQFYAAVEEREHPEFRGRPVVVGADPKKGGGRGVVSTCNYMARKHGVKSGMPISRAWKLVPDAVYVRPNFKLYIETSQRVMEILQRHSAKFERWGLDEAFLDVSRETESIKEAADLATEIKIEIQREEKLSCSIGVAANKLVAKIASDFRKPDGLTVVEPGKEAEFLAPLPVQKLLWVGKKTARKMKEIGVKTISDLGRIDESTLTRRFGTSGAYYKRAAQGFDDSEVAERTDVKSIGREVTFEEDILDNGKILATIEVLSETIHKEITDRDLMFKTVAIKIRFQNFETHTHARTLPFPANSLKSLVESAKELITPFMRQERMIRLVGVRVSNLIVAEISIQRTLFD